MKKNPTKVKLIKSYGNIFLIKFPKFNLTVNRYYYEKMANSPDEFLFL